MIRVRLFVAALMFAGCVGATSLAWTGDGTGGRTNPADPAKVLSEPTKSLDARVTGEKVTSYDPPPLPSVVTLPMPVDHRVAERREQVPISEAHWKLARSAVERGLAFLKSQQNERGGWMAGAQSAPTDQPERPAPVSTAVTAMVVKAFAQSSGNAVDEAELTKAVRYILDAREDEGMFGGSMANYVTSTVVSALSAVDRARFHDEVADAVKGLTEAQWDQGEGLNPRQDWFGGAGYGRHSRPDLSNTQMLLDALYDSGMSPDEPAMQRALAFVSRTQNLQATNKAEWTGNDGGFVYTPANGGESFASEEAGEGRYGEKSPEGMPRSLRSYGSMTYAGFKSMLYAGLSADDVRVRAAFDWVRRNWTFDENPGLGQQGLFYYYHTIARALRIAQQDSIEDTDGNTHNWREEMIDALAKRQAADGSWSNAAERWMEAEPVLATAYAVLALEEMLKATRE